MTDPLAIKPERLATDDNLFRIIVRKGNPRLVGALPVARRRDVR